MEKFFLCPYFHVVYIDGNDDDDDKKGGWRRDGKEKEKKMLINSSNQSEWLNFNQLTMQLNLMDHCVCGWTCRWEQWMESLESQTISFPSWVASKR